MNKTPPVSLVTYLSSCQVRGIWLEWCPRHWQTVGLIRLLHLCSQLFEVHVENNMPPTRARPVSEVELLTARRPQALAYGGRRSSRR